MLWKMLVHGLLAAILIGSAAAVYAQAKDNGYLSPAAPAGPADGSVRPAAVEARKDGERHKHAGQPKLSRQDRDDHRERDHDDDHDD